MTIPYVSFILPVLLLLTGGAAGEEVAPRQCSCALDGEVSYTLAELVRMSDIVLIVERLEKPRLVQEREGDRCTRYHAEQARVRAVVWSTADAPEVGDSVIVRTPAWTGSCTQRLHIDHSSYLGYFWSQYDEHTEPWRLVFVTSAGANGEL